MARGFKTGGRQKGTPNKRTLELIEGAKATGQMPLDYMLSVMRDDKADVNRRDDMARAAAPYLHAKITDNGMNLNFGEAMNGSSRITAELVGIRVEFVKPRQLDG